MCIKLFYLLVLVLSCNVLEGKVVDVKEVVILIGAPGSGKGTQAKGICTKLQIPHISTGDLFRDNVKRQTLLGKQVEPLLKEGKIVSDEIVINMLFDRVSQEDCQEGFLLDGYPRTIEQAKALDKRLRSLEHHKHVIYFYVSDEEVMRRLSGRLTCKNCSQMYHVESKPPKVTGICDQCGMPLYQREDDTPEVISKRLQAYHEQTEPVIEYYRGQNALQQIDGQQDPSKVTHQLLELLSSDHQSK
ncbi:MAG: adenylate kinase [Chlamydiales bacterium]